MTATAQKVTRRSLVLSGLGIPALGRLPRAARLTQSRPNFVVIIADDLDVASVAHMPAVERLLAAQGTTFDRFFGTTPLCGPSRSSILRGQYAHNHGVTRNTGEDAGFEAFQARGNEDVTMATLLDRAGYQTALIGKYLNGYASPDNQTYIPPGWDFWAAAIDHDAYNSFDYTLNVNGQLEEHGHGARDYMTDVLSRHALDFLDQVAGRTGPFFLYLAPYAPHAPAVPAPRDEGAFRGDRAPRTPAFNERNVRDKPQWVQQTGPLSKEKIQRIDDNYEQRLETLLGLDDMVSNVVQSLTAKGVLDSTYILFLSDNGYFMGEHRQPHGKDAPYDPAAQVPFIIRGPDIAAGATIDRLALNIDLLPTIADLAGLATPSFVDGRSLRPLLQDETVTWRQVALLEGFGKETESDEAGEEPTPAFRALRGETVLYVEYDTREEELYDLRRDPFQLSNLAADSAKPLLRTYGRRLEELASSARQECRAAENEPLPALPKKVSRESHLKHGRGNRRAPHQHRSRSREHRQASAVRLAGP